MADEKLETRTEQGKRKPYERPTLAKHGELKDLTAGSTETFLGCTKLFV